MVDSGKLVAGIAAVGGIGAVGAVLVKGYLDKKIPDHILTQLKRFYFYEPVAQRSLTTAVMLQKGREGDYETYVFGLGTGIAGTLPNDLIIEIGYNTVSKLYGITFAKLGWNALDIYLDNVVVRSLPAYTVVTTNLAGVCMILPLVE
jgi:hypothetical protein